MKLKQIKGKRQQPQPSSSQNKANLESCPTQEGPCSSTKGSISHQKGLVWHQHFMWWEQKRKRQSAPMTPISLTLSSPHLYISCTCRQSMHAKATLTLDLTQRENQQGDVELDPHFRPIRPTFQARQIYLEYNQNVFSNHRRINFPKHTPSRLHHPPQIRRPTAKQFNNF